MSNELNETVVSFFETAAAARAAKCAETVALPYGRFAVVLRKNLPANWAALTPARRAALVERIRAVLQMHRESDEQQAASERRCSEM